MKAAYLGCCTHKRAFEDTEIFLMAGLLLFQDRKHRLETEASRFGLMKRRHAAVKGTLNVVAVQVEVTLAWGG